MKAMVYDNYGSPDVLRLEEVAQPLPGKNEVLIKVCAASLNVAELHLVNGEPFIARLWSGLRKPHHRTPGSDVAGRVIGTGAQVTRFKAGDAVYGSCLFGACAEYVCAAQDALVMKPAGLTFEQAAALPMAGRTALQALRDHGRIRAGMQVLINGASGGVGSFSVQIARAFDAEVSAVCSPAKSDLVRSLGAQHVIDYTRTDFTRSGLTYDLILAVNGYHPLAHYRRALKPGGVYVMAGGTDAQIFEALLLGPLFSLAGGRKMGAMMEKVVASDLLALNAFVQEGKVVPLIDRRYPLEQTAAALGYLAEGHARGKVLIALDSAGEMT